MKTTIEKPTTTTPHLNSPKPAAPKIKRVSFGTAAIKKEETVGKYPAFNDPATGAQVVEIAQRIKERQAEFDALEGAIKTDKAELKMLVGPFYYTTNQNKATPPSSVSIPTTAGEVLVTFSSRYGKLESETPLEEIIGAEHVAAFVRQAFDLKISGEDLPVGKEQEIVDEIMAVLEKHHASSALEVKESLKPTPDFHVKRHSLFTPEQNQRIEQVWPIVAMIKTKGRGE